MHFSFLSGSSQKEKLLCMGFSLKTHQQVSYKLRAGRQGRLEPFSTQSVKIPLQRKHWGCTGLSPACFLSGSSWEEKDWLDLGCYLLGMGSFLLPCCSAPTPLIYTQLSRAGWGATVAPDSVVRKLPSLRPSPGVGSSSPMPAHPTLLWSV